MSGEERRKQILQILARADKATAAVSLARRFDVSRQVIVQDIALLRANGVSIFSTNRGYLIEQKGEASRVFKIRHTDEETEEEMNLIVDYGGKIDDVFVYHKVYGVVRAKMNIKSRHDVRQYLEDISTGKSSLLKNITSGYHYHTIMAESEEILNCIKGKLEERGFLAKLQDYEPVDFWGEEEC